MPLLFPSLGVVWDWRFRDEAFDRQSRFTRALSLTLTRFHVMDRCSIHIHTYISIRIVQRTVRTNTIALANLPCYVGTNGAREYLPLSSLVDHKTIKNMSFGDILYSVVTRIGGHKPIARTDSVVFQGLAATTSTATSKDKTNEPLSSCARLAILGGTSGKSIVPPTGYPTSCLQTTGRYDCRWMYNILLLQFREKVVLARFQRQKSGTAYPICKVSIGKELLGPKVGGGIFSRGPLMAGWRPNVVAKIGN